MPTHESSERQALRFMYGAWDETHYRQQFRKVIASGSFRKWINPHSPKSKFS